jgi:hypothetical protein
MIDKKRERPIGSDGLNANERVVIDLLDAGKSEAEIRTLGYSQSQIKMARRMVSEKDSERFFKSIPQATRKLGNAINALGGHR